MTFPRVPSCFEVYPSGNVKNDVIILEAVAVIEAHNFNFDAKVMKIFK